MNDPHPFPAERQRYDFLLNRYARAAFTRCPRCESKTAARKLPLAIAINEATIFVINKTCRLCPACDLLIARQRDIAAIVERFAHTVLEPHLPTHFQIIGTLERADWRSGVDHQLEPREIMARIFWFRSELLLEPADTPNPAAPTTPSPR